MKKTKITLVPTPIGNLNDITLRGLEVLRTAHRIVAEDTRHTFKLLQHFQIVKPLTSIHAHNEHSKIPQFLEEVVRNNEHIAVVSDAGTPGISDPGFLLVREALKMDIDIETLPGPTALIPALINSGLPCERFIFEGFLPVKKGRQTRLKELSIEQRTMIFYEAPHKILRTLQDLIEYLGSDRLASVSRELTKIHEENIRGNLQYILHYYQNHAVKGEFVLVVSGKE